MYTLKNISIVSTLAFCLFACQNKSEDEGGEGDTTSDGDSSGGGDSSSDDSTDVDDTSFIPPMDAMSIPMCDPWAEDCPAGEKCTPIVLDPIGAAWDANVCVPAGDQPPGSECTFVEGGVNGQDTCDATGFCWGQDPDTGIGQCVEECVGPENAPSCPQSGTACLAGINEGVLNLCLLPCDPINSACGGTLLCIPAYTGDPEVPDSFVCVPPGTGMPGSVGDSCVCANCCQTGTMCEDPANVGLDNCPDVDPSTQACCTALCDINSANPDQQCADAGLTGVECVAIYPQGTPDPLGKLGKCIIPQ